MNIDERLDALTQSVELLVLMHKDTEKMMANLGKQMEKLSQATERNGKANTRLEGYITEIAEGTARLLHVIEIHEQRINDLEGNQTQ
jgi:hypothetical protein